MSEKRTGNLYFKARGEKRLIAKNLRDIDQVMLRIKEFLNERNFKNYYTRVWKTDEGVMFDVGSHTEFFLWDGKYNFFRYKEDEVDD